MFSEEMKEIALKLYHECGSVTETTRILGYPTRRTLYSWIANEKMKKPERKTLQNINTAEHPRNPPVEVKLDTIHRCFELGESVKSVSEEIGYTRASIYTWRKKYLKRGVVALMNDKNIILGTLLKNCNDSLEKQTIEDLKAQMVEMQMEIDVLKETIEVLKKDPGVNMESLKNKEKTVVVDALREKYPLSRLLDVLHLSKSSYYYQKSIENQTDKYICIRKRIIEIFHENNKRYGYRRIYGILLKEGIIVSEKVIRRIMKEENLVVFSRKHRKYNSYKGEISPSVPNIVQRNFQADRPNEKWLTDITEFALPVGKVYLSPVVDCFDGMLPAWTINTTPDATLVNDMLDQTAATLPKGQHPLIHSDRGCHYRWPGWIERMERYHLTRSMSKKRMFSR